MLVEATQQPDPWFQADAPVAQPRPDGKPGMTGILILIPWPTNTGYAMHRAEKQFFAVAQRLVQNPERIFFAYRSLAGGHPKSLPENFRNTLACDFGDAGPGNVDDIERLIRERGIDVLVGYDLGVSTRWYSRLRRAGISTMISYWGAPMSQPNSGLVLLAKRLQVRLARSRPDHFVFQSHAMQELAVNGRGVPLDETSVIRTGIDISALPAREARRGYAHAALGVPTDRKLVIFSGHLHARKGIGTLIEAMQELVHRRGRRDVQAVLLGAIDSVSAPFVERVRQLELTGNVMFAGYRSDVFDIFASADIGVLPTTGWDSFPRSGLEMQGCGLPLVVARLHGLPEMIEEGVTGFTVTPGDPLDLAGRIQLLADDDVLRRKLGGQAGKRARQCFTDLRFVDEMTSLIRRVAGRRAQASKLGEAC
jgi:glycosyltransferase involved in cell wall biosynthesis